MITNFARNTALFLMLLTAFPALHGCGSDEHGHDDHDEGSGHGEHGEHGDHDEHDEHGGDVVELTPEQLTDAGVEIRPLSGGMISTHITLPAEVGLNQDTVLHVTPRATGIVTSVSGFLGAQVSAGDLLAVIESPALGEAKIAYLQAVQSSAIAEAELSRQQTISGNTSTLLGLLGSEPDLETLQSAVADLRIGENKGRLLSAYSRRKASAANYQRERELREKNLSTQSDLLAAQEAFNSSQADYSAIYEDIDFTYHLRLQDAQRSARVASSSVENASRRLHLLGLDDGQIEQITTETGAQVARYELRAPRSGRIVAKHITPGERVSGDDPVYTIADLDTVWLNISVYSQYVSEIREGQRVVVHAGDRAASGTVDYVGALVSESTRTVHARVVLENKDGSWKPGEFVTAGVETGQTSAARVVPIEAIQTFEGRQVVFVQHDDGSKPAGIEPVAIQTGRRSDRSVELLGDDIPLGTPIVVTNSFLMKSELGKGAAGHDH